MTRSYPNKGYSELTAKILEIFGREFYLAYAQLSSALRVVKASNNLHALISNTDALVEIVGQPLTDLFYEFVGAEKALEEVLNGKSPFYRIEKVNRAQADGSIIYLNFKVLPFNERQPAQGLLLIIEDATRTSQLEEKLVQDRNELRLARAQLERANAELQKLNRLKSVFLSIAAHDLRAPLSAIRGYTDLVSSGLSEDSPPEHREFLAIISSQVDMLDQLITDFLDLDLIEQGQLVINVQTCDLNAIVREVSGRMTELAKQKHICLVPNPSEGANWIEGDPQRIRQILYNLISNSIKYTNEGGQIEVKSWSDSQGGVVQVMDNGQGISKAGMKHLYRLYHRTGEALRSEVRGTGLGLFIVKSLVDVQNGKIDVVSQPGRGTSFTVQLPAPKTLA